MTALSALLLLGTGVMGAALQDGGPAASAWFGRNEFQIRRVLNLPPEMSLAYKDRKPHKVDGYDWVTLEVVRGEVRQSFDLVVSADGLMLYYDNRIYDLADPFAEIRSLIQLDRAPVIGEQDAPVTIVKYSDYTCGYCRLFYLTQQKELLEHYGDKVRFYHKLFPAIGQRSHAQQSAVASACAYRQGNEEFWRMHDRLFRNVKRFSEGEAIYLELAKDAGLDMVKFKPCMDRQDSLLDIANDQQEGIALGIDGTPMFFVNGRPIGGVPQGNAFYEIIDEELELAKGK